MPTMKRVTRRLLEFGPFKSAAETLVAQREKARKRLEELKRRREDLDMLPLHPDDVKTILADWVDKESASYSNAFHKMLVDHMTHAMGARERLIGPNASLLGLCTGRRLGYNEDFTQQAAVAWLFRDLIVRAINAEVDKIDLSGHGPLLAEREKEIAAIDEEIDAIESDLGLLTQAAREAGIAFRN